MINKAGVTITYDYDNRPQATGTTSFVYDYSGFRVKKITPSATITYVGKHYECADGVCKKYVFGGSQRVAVKTGTNTYYYYYHPDHLGSSSIVTDDTGNKSEEIYYYPFGGTRQDTGAVSVKHKFTGQELDDETGLYYYGARYYDPQLGRFISPDSIVQAPFDPQTLNRYSYCRNNPVIYIDPSGHWFGWNNIVGAIISAVVAGIQSDWDLQAMATGAAIGAISGGIGAEAGSSVSGNLLTQVVENAWTGEVYSTIGYASVNFGGSLAGGVAGGAVNGGLNAAVNGNDIAQGMLMGAAQGAVISMVSTPNFSPFGGSAAGSIGNRLFNSALTGAGLGAVYSYIKGDDIGQGALNGAMLWTAGEAAHMIAGHTVGFIGSGGNAPKFENGVFYYDAPQWSGWITLSNVISGPYSRLDRMYTLPDGRTFNYRQHEVGHTPQGTVLGPAYGAAHILSLTVGGVVGVFSGFGFERGSHCFGVLERWVHPAPCYDYE